MPDLKKAASGTRRPWGVADLLKARELAPNSSAWASSLPPCERGPRSVAPDYNPLDTASQ